MATTVTQTDVNNLETAIKSGARTVSVQGRSVTYGSKADMVQTLAWMKNLLLAASSRRMGGVAGYRRG